MLDFVPLRGKSKTDVQAGRPERYRVGCKQNDFAPQGTAEHDFEPQEIAAKTVVDFELG